MDKEAYVPGSFFLSLLIAETESLAHKKNKTGLPTGMSHRTACGWSQVRIDSGPVDLCSPVALYRLQ